MISQKIEIKLNCAASKRPTARLLLLNLKNKKILYVKCILSQISKTILHRNIMDKKEAELNRRLQLKVLVKHYLYLQLFHIYHKHKWSPKDSPERLGKEIHKHLQVDKPVQASSETSFLVFEW